MTALLRYDSLILMITLHDETWEFIAKIVSDLGKAVLTVGFASYFFEKLPLILRVVFTIAGVTLIIYSVIIYEKSKKGAK